MPAITALVHRVQKSFTLLVVLLLFTVAGFAQQGRTVADFDKGWRFNLGDVAGAQQSSFTDAGWRVLNLPHDWSIEGTFSKDNPASPEGGALPGGIGWYRKTFTVPASAKNKQLYIDFDGVYQKSTVWVNGHELGFRPNGYISFRYELTPYLNFGGTNTIAVKVDNSVQPNSRWYSGSGIYRNVWLVTTNKIAVDHWGTYITTPEVSAQTAKVDLKIKVKNNGTATAIIIKTAIYDAAGKAIAEYGNIIPKANLKDTLIVSDAQLTVKTPMLWSVGNPYLYKVVTKVIADNIVVDEYTTPLGIRYFNFDADKGFSLNGKPLKILGVYKSGKSKK